MIIFHAHSRQGTSRQFLCYELLIDNYKYWYSNITGFSLTVLNYYCLFIITNIVTRFFVTDRVYKSLIRECDAFQQHRLH